MIMNKNIGHVAEQLRVVVFVVVVAAKIKTLIQFQVHSKDVQNQCMIKSNQIEQAYALCGRFVFVCVLVIWIGAIPLF